MAIKGTKRKAPEPPTGADDADAFEAAMAGEAGEAGEASEGAAAGDVSKAQKKESFFQVPEAAEVLEIAQTRNLFKTNLFRLQLEELLREVAPKSKARERLGAVLKALNPVLGSIKAKDLGEDFAKQFPALRFHQRKPFPFSFAPPSRFNVAGSFLLGTCTGPGLSADLVLEMPKESFQSKDYLNFRYLDKRTAYVGELHKQLLGLLKASAVEELSSAEVFFETVQGDPFKPCVVLRGADGGWSVRLLPTIAADTWILSKLAPSRNAVRPLDGKEEATPSAHYNSYVLEDTKMLAHLELLHQTISRIPSLRDAILLTKRWAWARSFLPQQNGHAIFSTLNGFCLSMVAAHAAVISGVAPSQASSFQLFKLTLGVLANTDWASHKVVFGQAAPAKLTSDERDVCRAQFYDSDGILNIFWRLGPFIEEIRWEAQRALKILDTEHDPYESVFGHCSSPELLWDLTIRTKPLDIASLCPTMGATMKEDYLPDGPLIPADMPRSLALGTRLSRALRAGLGDRCTRVAVRLVGDVRTRWTDKPPSKSVVLLVGVVFDPLNLDRALDRGPSAQDAAAAQFRQLWGAEKAELRRFKDGSILECAVWSKPSKQSQVESRKEPAVVTQVVNHLLKRHFPDVSEGCDLVSGPSGLVSNLADRGRRVWVAFEAFRTHICQLSSLPLSIKDVHPADTAFSYTDIATQLAPAAADGATRTLHSVIVEFESSGRWPDEPEAARKVCSALLLQMREELRSDFGLEADVAESFMDVRYPEFTFRIRIFHPHELATAAHRVTNFNAQVGGALPDAEVLERLRVNWWRPRLRSCLHAQVLQQPATAGAVRLFQRWLSSQLLSGYEEFAEHLVAATFFGPAPFEAPTSAHVGMCRALRLLASYDWKHEPLVVDFDGKLTDEERLSIRTSFESSHEDASSGTTRFSVHSRFDPHALLLETPPATVSAWLQKRARKALAVCNSQFLDATGSAPGWRELFSVDTSVFDMSIRLQRGADRTKHVADAQEAVLELVASLRSKLGAVCLVFFDAENAIVALKWRPASFLPQHHNVLMGALPHTMLANERDGLPLCVPNVLLLTAMVHSLTEGLALDVTIMGAQG